jgi:Icc-related predicted phosphoesterase
MKKNENHSNSIFLFHAPPYKTNLDKIGSSIESDSHVGSIAIRKFIEQKQPYLTLHGHIHESTRITGKWKDKIGRTICFNGAHDGEEVSIIKFHIDNLENAERILI